MPETRGLPEYEEPTPTRIRRAIEENVPEAIAGQGIVRRVVLWVALFVLVVTPAAPLAVVPAVLLMATDKGLA